MNRTKIIYWTSTILFAGFMLFSAIPDIMIVDAAKEFLTHLGYPIYFIPFIGVAKALGCIAILIPGLKLIKEWAYAGLIFDLVGAVYSNIMVDGLQPGMAMMIPVFVIAFTSYLWNRKVNA